MGELGLAWGPHPPPWFPPKPKPSRPGQRPSLLAQARGRPGRELFSNRAPKGVPKRSDIEFFMIFDDFRPSLGQSFW